MAITKPAAVPQLDPDAEQAAIEAAAHDARSERNGSSAGVGRAPRLEQPRQRVMVNLQPDMIPELDRRAAEYGYSRSMYLQRIIAAHFEHLREQEAAEVAAREQVEKNRAAAQAKRDARRAATRAAARKRARAQ
jgi:hypothetical protein